MSEQQGGDNAGGRKPPALPSQQPSARAQRDLELWHTWNNNGRKPEHLEPLLKAFDPIVSHKVSKWSGGVTGVTPEYMRSRVEHHLIEAFHKFDPSRGYALSTYVERPMYKAQRERNEIQNAGKVSEQTASNISPVQSAIEELTASNGRKPTAIEISKHLGLVGHSITPAAVKRVQKQVRKDVPSSVFEDDPSQQSAPWIYDNAPLVRAEFEQPPWDRNPHILRVYDHMFGLNGAQSGLSGNQLAKKLGISPSALSQMKGHILNKLKGMQLPLQIVDKHGPGHMAGPFSFLESHVTRTRVG